jgi:acyl-CoA thioesterase
VDELAGRVKEAMFAKDSAARHMGIAIGEVGPGFAIATMTVREHMLNGHRIAHGGFVFALADTAFAYACNARNEATVALSCSISFAKAVNEGDVLVATARERTRANRTSTYDVDVTRGAEVVALFRGTAYRVAGTHV